MLHRLHHYVVLCVAPIVVYRGRCNTTIMLNCRERNICSGRLLPRIRTSSQVSTRRAVHTTSGGICGATSDQRS